MNLEKELNAYFVKTIQEDVVNYDFLSAENFLRGHLSDDKIRHLKASEVYPLIASGKLTKKDIFIFDQFEGECFQQLQKSTKALIVGPRCVIKCIVNCVPIPHGTSPVFTTAMRDLKISASGISPQEKERISTLIQWMGGYYFQNLGRSVTHLVSNTIKSTKYEHATLNGIPVMHVDWVKRVWERSCVKDVLATDGEFDKYRLPIFFGTNITCTGLDNDKKNEIMRLVNENGGTYHRAFRSQYVDIVITEKSKTGTDKYQAALRFKKDILLPEWIFESVQKGFALPTKNYEIKSLKVSTPTKTDQSIANFTSTDQSQLSNISCISTIEHAGAAFKQGANDSGGLTLNETASSTFLAPQPPATVPSKTSNLQRDVLLKSQNKNQMHHYREVYDEICPKLAKKAGTFLDGCCIYLSGFRPDEREKLNRILNSGGATRYDSVKEGITHIIVGKIDDTEFKNFKKNNFVTGAHIVRLNWLLESIKLKQAANENIYKVSLPAGREPETPSPSSKKTLRSMNHSFQNSDIPTKKKLFQVDSSDHEMDVDEPTSAVVPIAASTELNIEEENLLAQYSQDNVATMPSLPPPKQASSTNDFTLMNEAPSTSLQNRPSEANAKKTASVNVVNAEAQPSESVAGITIDYEVLDCFKDYAIFVNKAHFSGEFYTQMISECEAAKGSVVGDSFRDAVDYAIVSFERPLNVDQLPVQAKYIVTELFVEACIRENKIVPIEYYHKHIPHTVEKEPLTDMNIVISTYTGLERDFIQSLAKLLGARLNDSFIKREAPLLICPEPQGAKYKGAMKWRFPVVTSAWLVDCAEQGIKLPYSAYLVGDSPADFPTPNSKSSLPADTPNSKSHLPTDTPNRCCSTPEVTPLRNRRVSQLAGHATNNSPVNQKSPNSPHTPLTQCLGPAYNLDYMEEIISEMGDEANQQFLRDFVNEIRNNPTPELERMRRQACTPMNRNIPTPKSVLEFCSTPAFKQRLAEERDKRWRLPIKKLKPDTPLNVLCRRQIRETCRSQGIPCFGDDDDGTSTGDDGKNNDKSEENTSTQSTPGSVMTINKRQMSSARSTRQQQQQQQRMETDNTTPFRSRKIETITTKDLSSTSSCSEKNESLSSQLYVPNTQEPNAVSVCGDLGQRASILGKSSLNLDKISFEESETINNDDEATVSRRSSSANKRSAGRSSVNALTPELKQISDYVNRRQSSKNRITPKPTFSEMMEFEEHNVQRFETEQLPGSEHMVDWHDPTEFNAEKRPVALPPMQHKGTPRFSISCSDITPEDIIEKILKLGGSVSENLVNFDPDCTHFICEKPNRGEKILSCISSGKWILGLGYIEESFARDAFVDEELYEWGNCKAVNLPELSEEEKVIARAAHRWRRQLKGDKDSGAFKGFRVILRSPPKNFESLKTVIKAGKGEVIEAISPYSEKNNAHLATHCFVDVKKMPLTPSDYGFLKKHNVIVATQLYINGSLMNAPQSDLSKYEIKM